jgi:hypothetical protein
VVTWIGLMFLGLLFVLTLLIAVPVGVIALAASPDVRRVAKRGATMLAPLVLAGLGLMFFIAIPQRVEVVRPGDHAPPAPTVVSVETPAESLTLTAPFAEQAEALEPPRLIKIGHDALPDWMRVAVLGVGISLLAGAAGFANHTGQARWILVPVIGLVAIGGLAWLKLQRVEQSEAVHRDLVVKTQHAASAQAAHFTAADRSQHEQERQARLAGSVDVHADAIVLSGEPINPVETSEAPAPDAASINASTPVAITQFVGESRLGQAVTELPEWVAADRQTDVSADTETFVLRSLRYSSVAEADDQLLRNLQPYLHAYLLRGGVSIDVTRLTLADIQRAHLRIARVVEQFDQPLKSSVEPVYRVAWQVSLRPVVRDALGAEYRLAVRDQRLWQLGLGAGLLTLLFGTWAAYFRIDDQTQGRYRGRLQLAAAGATLAQMAVLFVA